MIKTNDTTIRDAVTSQSESLAVAVSGALLMIHTENQPSKRQGNEKPHE
jgi:hypothetical protein